MTVVVPCGQSISFDYSGTFGVGAEFVYIVGGGAFPIVPPGGPTGHIGPISVPAGETFGFLLIGADTNSTVDIFNFTWNECVCLDCVTFGVTAGQIAAFGPTGAPGATGPTGSTGPAGTAGAAIITYSGDATLALTAGNNENDFTVGFPGLRILFSFGTGPATIGNIGFRAPRSGTLSNLYFVIQPGSVNGAIFTSATIQASAFIYTQGSATDSTTTLVPQGGNAATTLFADFDYAGAPIAIDPPNVIATNSNITPGSSPATINQGDMVLLQLHTNVTTSASVNFPFNYYGGMTFS
jgi:hypothetical protein